MKTKTRILVYFIAFTIGSAILQSIIGLIWKSENLILHIVYGSLTVGGIYLLFFFLFSRRRVMLTFWIFFGIFVTFTITSQLLNIVPANVVTVFRTVPSITHLICYFVVAIVAYNQAKPICEAKNEKWYRNW